jgi:dihydrofolate reductase
MGISIIAAIGSNRAIGRDNKLLWSISADLRRFSEYTRERPVVMGRKTFDSILERNGCPLPHRPHIVVTRNTHWAHDGVRVAHTVTDALVTAAKFRGDPFVIGGENIFRESLPHVSMLYLTLVDDAPDADAFFPEYLDRFEELWRQPKPGLYKNITYQFANFRRRNPN